MKQLGGVKRLYERPAQVRALISRKLTTDALRQSGASTAMDLHSLASPLNDRQKLAASSRKGVLTALDCIMQVGGISREARMTALLTQAKLGQLDAQLETVLRSAGDKRGRKGDGFPSVRTLKRWLAQEKVSDLAPKVVHADYEVPAWAKTFPSFYQQPQKPSVELAYREFTKAYRACDTDWSFPTIRQVRRSAYCA